MKSFLTFLFVFSFFSNLAFAEFNYDHDSFTRLIDSMDMRNFKASIRRIDSVRFPNQNMKREYKLRYRMFSDNIGVTKVENRAMAELIKGYVKSLENPPRDFNPRTSKLVICSFMDMSRGDIYQGLDKYEFIQDKYPSYINNKFTYLKKSRNYLDRILEHTELYKDTFECNYRSEREQRRLTGCVKNGTAKCYKACERRTGNGSDWCVKKCNEGSVGVIALIQCAGIQ